MSTDDSWNRVPDAKLRLREDGLKRIVKALENAQYGYVKGGVPSVRFIDDGATILFELGLNVGVYPNIVYSPVEILIPVPKEYLSNKVDDEESEISIANGSSGVKLEEATELVSSGVSGGSSEFSDGLGVDASSEQNEVVVGDGVQSCIGNDVENSEIRP